MRGSWLFVALALLVQAQNANKPAGQTQPATQLDGPAGPNPRQLLAAHNAARAQVGVAPLAWSPRLEALAQQWANALLARDQFTHSLRPGLGENLYEITGGYSNSSQVVAAWLAERSAYDYSSNTCRGVCGHYTQIIWRQTRAVGCAAARNPRREVWVCNYDPPGNWRGQRPY